MEKLAVALGLFIFVLSVTALLRHGRGLKRIAAEARAIRGKLRADPLAYWCTVSETSARIVLPLMLIEKLLADGHNHIAGLFEADPERKVAHLTQARDATLGIFFEILVVTGLLGTASTILTMESDLSISRAILPNVTALAAGLVLLLIGMLTRGRHLARSELIADTIAILRRGVDPEQKATAIIEELARIRTDTERFISRLEKVRLRELVESVDSLSQGLEQNADLYLKARDQMSTGHTALQSLDKAGALLVALQQSLQEQIGALVGRLDGVLVRRTKLP